LETKKIIVMNKQVYNLHLSNITAKISHHQILCQKICKIKNFV
jgi:hypothetical protein